jgi:microcystin-dependent protein
MFMDPYVGEIRLFAGNYAPSGWVFCQGQELQIQQNQVLYSVIGTMYGGDGKNTFAVPNLTGRVPMHTGNGNGLTPRVLGSAGGEMTITLTEDQIPSHSHDPNSLSTTGDETSPVGALWANTAGGRSPVKAYSQDSSIPMNPTAINTVGGSQSHNNMQPYLAINFIMAYEGVYPPKS